MDDVASHLLLVAADDRAPALSGPASLAGAARHPTSAIGSPTYLWSEGDHPDDLAAQRWAVFAPEGPAGDVLLEAIAPLMAHRAAEQGAPAVVFRVPPRLGPAEAARWKRQVFSGSTQRLRELPRFHLVLGDLDAISVDLQVILASDGHVGRLAFDRTDDYAAYVSKVLRHEQGASEHALKAIFHSVLDGTRATTLGHRALMAPGLALARAELPGLEVRGAGEAVPDPGELLRLAGGPAPAVLLSLSHGEGAPRRGWRSVAEQRAGQGAMSFGREGRLGADDLAGATFLPGGVWLMLACFSAGTPSASKFRRWLEALAAHGAFDGDLDAVERSLPPADAPPFVAALPKALLAAEHGPLAFIGHLDLAWSYSFRELDGGGVYNRPGRFVQTVASLLRGHRIGVAFRELSRCFAQVDTDLAALTEAGVTDELRRAHLWLLRQDLAGFVVLGDPAARMPVPKDSNNQHADRTPAHMPVPKDIKSGAVERSAAADLAAMFPGVDVRRPAAGPPADIEALERAIGRVLADPNALTAAAAAVALAPRALADLVERYRRAGRRAIDRG